MGTATVMAKKKPASPPKPDPFAHMSPEERKNHARLAAGLEPRESKAEPAKAKGSVAKSKEPAKVPRDMVVGMRGSPEWKGWLDRLADHCRLNKVDVIDLALVDYAQKMGFEAPPKR